MATYARCASSICARQASSSAGSPITAGGTLHIIEAVRHWRGEGGERQVPNAKLGLVSGLGVLPYGKNLGCCAVAVLANEA
jgi:hypothetical protein